MTLEQLRIFIAVAEREHMTRAGEALGLTQSAVSAAVAALEARYGVALFHRVGRAIELSAEGRLFLDEARAVLARAQAAERALSDLSGLARGALRVQASQTIASYWLPQVLVAFHRAHPGIDVTLGAGNTEQVANAVRTGDAELGFVEGRIDDAALTATPIGKDRLVVVVGPQHPWATKRRFSFEHLAESEWVLRERGSGTRSEFEAALRAQGFEPSRLNVALELPSNEAVRAAVEGGAGATALSELAAGASIAAGRLKRINLALPERAFCALQHKERYASRAARAFMDFCRPK